MNTNRGLSCRAKFLAAIALALTTGWASAAGVPDDLQSMFDVGQYQPLIPRLNAAVAKTGSGPSEDRYNLLMMKGDALLHLKASGAAVDAFTAAARAGMDDNAKSVARGTANLVRHSSLGRYMPKTKSADGSVPAGPIDIVDATSRKEAFGALLSDLLAVVTPQVNNASEITNLPAIMSLGKKVADARDVEIAGTGADTQTKDLLDKLAAQAGSILGDALKPLDAEVQAAEKDAGKRQKQMGRRAPKDEFASLSPTDSDQLDSAIEEAREVSDAATQMQPIFGDAGDLKTVQEDAEKIITAADKVLSEYHHPGE